MPSLSVRSPNTANIKAAQTHSLSSRRAPVEIFKMASYKLIYFNGKGRAELARFVFAQAGVQYEDKRLAGEEWQTLKPTTPYGSIPVLEVDGKMLAGSNIIARYLAEEFGLAGSNAFENAEIDSVSDMMGDLMVHVMKFRFEKDEARKAEFQKELAETHFPRFLGILEKLVANNASGWLYGPKVTWVDLKFSVLMSFLLPNLPELLKNFPGLAKLNDTVEKLPNIARWLEQRPVTEH